ncbi:MAG: RES family NAD+ phosphorylase [Acidobacteriaceae bacterium]
MIKAWRITKTTDIKTAFSGEGARLYGGRWNSKGIAVVYVAATRSLAMLEILVHMRNTRQTVHPIPYMLFPASFDERLIEELPPSSLPADWDLEPPTDSTKSIGDAWVSAASTTVLVNGLGGSRDISVGSGPGGLRSGAAQRQWRLGYAFLFARAAPRGV